MKETVAKSAQKPASGSMASAARKPGVVKTVAAALAKKIAAVLAPAIKAAPLASAKAPAKPAARPAPRSASKAVAPNATKATSSKPVAKAAPAKAVPKKAASKVVAKAPAAVKAVPEATTKAVPAPALKAAALKAVPATAAAQAKANKTVAQQAVKAGETGGSTGAVGGVTAELADKMKTSVVSKVSEVMTKTTKSTPAVNTEGRLISEDEIRAMGEKDYMNPAQLAFFKARLQQLEKDLLKNAGETTEHLRETVLVPDPADRATIEEEHALELRTRDRERKLLKKVQQSIAAIDGGDYGWCEETGEPIGIPRLIARPTATLSLEAQQRRELKQKLYGD